MQILVGYTSSHGSTAEIAHRIAGALQRADWAVEVLAVREIADPGAYDAVVLGSAIHNQEWLPEATELSTAIRTCCRPARCGCSAWECPPDCPGGCANRLARPRTGGWLKR